MNWITRWKKIGIKVKQILKKQPIDQEEIDWKNCPQCKKISYKPDLFSNSYICECSFHFDLPPKLRLDSLFDSDYEIIETPKNIDPDPLNFEVKDGSSGGYKYIDKIKKAGIPTFAIAARAVAGGTFGSSFFMHDFIIIESKYVENLLFSGKRVTANILKSLDQIPEDFGMASSIIKSGLADMTLENRKELKDTLVKLGSIILKKGSLDKKDSTSDIPEEQTQSSLQKTSEAV